MLSRSQQLLLVIGLCVSVARADVDCNKMPSPVNPKTCCPLPELITDEIKEKCKEQNILPPLPTDMPSKMGELRRPPPHMFSPCFFSCVFNETGLYKDNDVDVDALKNFLIESFKDAELQSVAEEALTNCSARLKDFKDPQPSQRQPMCPQKPAFLMGCIFRKTMLNCPASIRNDSTECTAQREFIQTCRPLKF